MSLGLYRLECATCRTKLGTFGVFDTSAYACGSLVSDDPRELLAPDFEEVARHAGDVCARRLREFHEKHSGSAHCLEAVDLEPHKEGAV